MDKMKTFIPMSQLAMGFDEDIDLLIGQLHEAGAKRLYFCGFPPAFAPREQLLKSAEEFGRIVKIFEAAGFEVSAWLGGTLGHGGAVLDGQPGGYTRIENIDEFLGFKHEIYADVVLPAPKINSVARRGRVNLTDREASERKHDFDAIEHEMTCMQADMESSRCLHCDYFGFGNFRGGRETKW